MCLLCSEPRASAVATGDTRIMSSAALASIYRVQHHIVKTLYINTISQCPPSVDVITHVGQHHMTTSRFISASQRVMNTHSQALS